MTIPTFTVTGKLAAIRTDGPDALGEPDEQAISATVWFRPSIEQAYGTDTLYRINPLRARTDPTSGVLKTIDGNPVKLVAASAAHGTDNLYWSVTFEDVVYDQKAFPNPIVEGWRSKALAPNATIDLAAMTKLPLERM